MQTSGRRVQTAPSPVSWMFPTPKATAPLSPSTPLAGARGAEHNQNDSAGGCGESKAGSASASDWIGRIKSVWARGPASTLELARLMCAVRQQLLHGEWTALWNAGDLPFSKRKGEMLVAIGERLGWAGAQTFARLPVGWSIVYHLARLDRTTLERLVQEGVIHPALKLWEAKDLIAQFNGGPNAVRAKRFNVQQRLQKFGEFVDTTSNDWSPRERRWAQTRLQEILHQIAAEQNLSEPLPAGRSNASQWSRFSTVETNSLNAQRSTQ